MNPIYEVHVTIEGSVENLIRAQDFSDYAKSLNGKPIFIELSHGEYRIQPMVGIHMRLQDDAEALKWADMLGAATNMAGWKVVRVKLESQLTDGPVEYFEAHWKFNTANDEIFNLPRVGYYRADGILHSRNLLNPHTYYLSQRDYGKDSLVAGRLFNHSGVAMVEHDFSLEKVHYERVILDTNPSLDFGWTSK